MKTTSKRVISLLLAIMMVLSIFTIVPLTASAETTSTTETAGTSTVTAKALYKSHKIEWSSAGNEETTAFAITKNDGTDITSTVTATITSVKVGDVSYYTALVNVGTGVNSGATYTVKNGDTVIGTATVEDATSKEALLKNALFAKNYGTDGKQFSGTKEEYKDAVTLAKVKALYNGAIFASAISTKASNPQAIISFTDTFSNTAGLFMGIRNANYRQGGRFGTYWIMGDTSMPFSVKQNVAVQITCSNSNTQGGVYKVTSLNKGSVATTNAASGKTGTQFLASGASSITGIYIGHQWTGTIYYAVISEETYTDAELLTIDKNLATVTGESSGTAVTLTWAGTSTDGCTIKANGVAVGTITSLTCEDGTCTAVVPVTTKTNTTYTVETSTQIGSTLVNYVEPTVKVPAPEGFTAKALYKSHKIEWKTTNYENAVFELYEGDKELDVTPTTVDIDGTRYYTVMLDVTTGTGINTVYTLKGNIENEAYPTDTVEDNTGFAALRKNALFVVDYENDADTTSDCKSFEGGAGTKVEGVTALQAKKLSQLQVGAIFAFANYKNTTDTTQALISFSTYSSKPSWMGVRNGKFGGQINEWLKGNNAPLVSQGAHLTVAYYSGLTTDVGNMNWGYSVDGLVEGGMATKTSFMKWKDDTDNDTITTDSIYVGNTSTSNEGFYGDVYYVIVSEEKYTSAEIGDITKNQSPYAKLSDLLTTTKTEYLTTGKYKNDGAFKNLESALTKYSAYTATTSFDELNAAIADINGLTPKVTVRTTELATEAIDKAILKNNADDNSHAASNNDGSAVNMFDGSTTTLWHSFYTDGGGLRPYSDTVNVNATHPVWMQTGFDKTEYITKIECKPRTDSGDAYLKHQIRNYEVYVSNNETKPFANVSVSETDDWTLVKSGTLDAITSSNANDSQVITFTQPVEAKWIRIVVTSTSSGTLLCVAEMNIYKVSDTVKTAAGYEAQINDKIAEAQELLNNKNATVVKGDATYTAYEEALAAINAKDLTTEATQDDLDKLNTAIAALKFTTTNADGGTVTYTAAAQQTIDSIDEKIEEAKHIIMQAGVVDTAELEEQITALEAEALTVTTSESDLKTKLAELEAKINTAKTNEKEVNKADKLANDSVKWNNTKARLDTLKANVTTNVEREENAVKYIFDGNYLLNDSTTDKHYGSWRETESERRAPWISIKLGESVCVSGLVIFDRLAAGGTTSQNYFKNFEVWVSNDENFTNYVIAASGTRTDSTYSTSGYEVKFDQPYDCKYIKFVTYGDVDCKIVEMDIYQYVGAKEAKPIKVTTSTAASIETGTSLGEINFSKKFKEDLTFEELQSQMLDINLSDIAHNYEISVDESTLQFSVVASDIEYTLTVSNSGNTVTQTKKYGENFNYKVEGAKGWKISGNVVCDGDTFNYKATDDMSAVAVIDEQLVQSVSAYIPAPVISYNGTKYTVQIPVYINGTTNYESKGVVFVKSGTSVDTIKNAILGTASNYVKIFSAGDNAAVALNNKGRYLHNITINGNLPAGVFYAYVVTANADGTKTVTLSNNQVRTIN